MFAEQRHSTGFPVATRAIDLVHQYGSDSLCYLSLSQEKFKYFGQSVQGLISYVVLNRTVVCLGDPICNSAHLQQLLREFQDFCKRNNWKICFSSISDDVVAQFRQHGFVVKKYGEEAKIELQNYVLAGKKTIKLRNKISQAERAGLTVTEYAPKVSRDSALEAKIDAVSAEWFTDKKAKLTFSLGDLHLDDPCGRRYFVSQSPDGQVHAILMFSPYAQQQGYFLDVMRRRKQHTLPGVMEHAIISAAMQLKAEGVAQISLGLVPLAGIDQEHMHPMVKRFLHFIFKHVNSEYGFESLYNYKKKFAPTEWRNRYIAYEKSIPLYKVWMVMIKARKVKGAFQQFVKGVWQLIHQRRAAE